MIIRSWKNKFKQVIPSSEPNQLKFDWFGLVWFDSDLVKKIHEFKLNQTN